MVELIDKLKTIISSTVYICCCLLTAKHQVSWIDFKCWQSSWLS